MTRFLRPIFIGTAGTCTLFLDSLFLPIITLIIVTNGIGLLLVMLPAFVIHECAHLLACKAFGCKAAAFTLSPMGGSFKITTGCVTSAQLFIIYLAGSAANLLFYLIFTQAAQHSGNLLLSQFALTNLGLAIFNLLPALPLDGGRMLCELLKEHKKPSFVSSVMFGIGIVFSFLLFGLFGYLAICCHLFIWQLLCTGVLFLLHAFSERHMDTARNVGSLLGKSSLLHQKHTLAVQYICLHQNATLADALKSVHASHFNMFTIVDEKFSPLFDFDENTLLQLALSHAANEKIIDVAQIR